MRRISSRLVGLNIERLHAVIRGGCLKMRQDYLFFVWFDCPGESSPEKDCCW